MSVFDAYSQLTQESHCPTRNDALAAKPFSSDRVISRKSPFLHRKLYLPILQAVVSIALLTTALTLFQWAALVTAVGRLSLGECALAVIFALLSVLLTAIRWYVLVRRKVPRSL